MINLYKHDLGPYIYFGFSIALAHLFSERKLFCVVSAPKSKSTGAVRIKYAKIHYLISKV